MQINILVLSFLCLKNLEASDLTATHAEIAAVALFPA